MGCVSKSNQSNFRMKLPTPIFSFGQRVYLKANTDFTGLVTGYLFRPQTSIVYLISWSDGETREHWDMELTTEKGIDGVIQEEQN